LKNSWLTEIEFGTYDHPSAGYHNTDGPVSASTLLNLPL